MFAPEGGRTLPGHDISESHIEPTYCCLAETLDERQRVRDPLATSRHNLHFRLQIETLGQPK